MRPAEDMIAGEDITEEERREVLERVIEKLANKGEDKYSTVDLERLKTDEEYLNRFWLHASLMEGGTMDNTVKMVVDNFVWRKEFKVEHIKEELISKVPLRNHNHPIDYYNKSKLTYFTTAIICRSALLSYKCHFQNAHQNASE